MTGNFDFLKNKDNKLYNIINDAEKLYRDGYFEQTIVQTRKFAELLAKNTLGIRRSNEETFDEILATLNDMAGDSVVEKEFIDDMYFLKKQGNLAAHESAKEQDGNIALECLKRAFEASISYSIKNRWGNKKLLNQHYSIDLLMTGKKYKFSEKYQKIREEAPDNIKEEVQNLADFANNKKEAKEVLKKQNKAKTKEKKAKKQNKPDTKDKKVISADFKKKKIIKKAGKKEQKTKEAKENKLFYAIIFSILIIFLISIFLFIFPF